MRIAFIGCVQFSYVALATILQHPEVEVVGVVTRRASAFNTDFVSLESLATANAVPCYLVEDPDQAKLADWLASLAPDVIYCIGWSSLLNVDILRTPPLGVVGYHPAALPKNRGRHPIIWALVLGLEETASTFFLMDEGADSGDILNQRFVPVLPTDDASSLYDRLLAHAEQQIGEVTEAFLRGSVQRVPQDSQLATYWRKRTKADGLIDWRMSATSIYNLVRALSRPYPGAHCLYLGQDVKIWRVQPSSEKPANIEPGKVLAADLTCIKVACGEGVVDIISHEFPELPRVGSYL